MFIRNRLVYSEYLSNTSLSHTRLNPSTRVVSDFEKAIGTWLSWDPIEAFSKSEEIVEKICTVVVQFTAVSVDSCYAIFLR